MAEIRWTFAQCDRGGLPFGAVDTGPPRAIVPLRPPRKERRHPLECGGCDAAMDSVVRIWMAYERTARAAAIRSRLGLVVRRRVERRRRRPKRRHSRRTPYGLPDSASRARWFGGSGRTWFYGAERQALPRAQGLQPREQLGGVFVDGVFQLREQPLAGGGGEALESLFGLGADLVEGSAEFQTAEELRTPAIEDCHPQRPDGLGLVQGLVLPQVVEPASLRVRDGPTLATRDPADAPAPAGRPGCGGAVPGVDRSRDEPKVAFAVVEFVAVDVVDDQARRRLAHHEMMKGLEPSTPLPVRGGLDVAARNLAPVPHRQDLLGVLQIDQGLPAGIVEFDGEGFHDGRDPFFWERRSPDRLFCDRARGRSALRRPVVVEGVSSRFRRLKTDSEDQRAMS